MPKVLVSVKAENFELNDVQLTPEQNRCIPIATNFAVLLSISKFGLTSENSTIFVFASDAAYFTS